MVHTFFTENQLKHKAANKIQMDRWPYGLGENVVTTNRNSSTPPSPVAEQ